MVEDTVQDDVHTSGFGLGCQSLEVCQGAEIVVDLQVVGGVVFVIGGRFEDGVEVDGCYAQIFQVIELSMMPWRSPP